MRTITQIIEQEIESLLAAPDKTLEWLIPAVRQHRFLPVYLGWTAVLGIRPDGTLVEWLHEDSPETVRPIQHPFWCRLALCQGARKYPALKPLIPARPVDAVQCDGCSGTGIIGALPTMICKCGGLGWLIAGEPPPEECTG